MRAESILILIATVIVVYSLNARSDSARRIRTEIAGFEQVVLDSACPPSDGSAFCHYMALLLSRR